MASSKQDFTKNVFRNVSGLFHNTALSDCMSGNFFSKPNTYCCDRAMQEELSKITQRNTLTSLKTLIKSHEGLEGIEVLAQRCFR